ncbi:hypothetical protein LP421_15040 [Rhizobium sp. RCAM05350]|nr:hypothetical protein LP421_15040 [Rhizobium sp. RCAM05350]
MYYDFVPRQKDAEIRMNNGRPESIGKFVRDLEIEGVKELFREGIHQIVEYNTSGFLVWVPPSECFAYWNWAQPHIAKEHLFRLEDYPEKFWLSISEWISDSGGRLIVFSWYH